MVVYSSRVPFVEKKSIVFVKRVWLVARLCRLRDWRLTGCKYFDAGMAVWPWWILWNMEILVTFLLFSKVSHWRDSSTDVTLLVHL